MSVATRVDDLFAWCEPDSPGAAAVICVDGAIRHACGYGLANIEAPTAITPTTIFDACSIAKPFVALTITSLVSERRLDLDAALRSWIPELPGCMEGIALRHLLANTSGIRDFNSLAYLTGRTPSDLSSAGILELLARQQRLNFQPGQGFLYSHSDYFLLAICAERAAGRGFAALSHDRIFAPLGMDRTSFLDDGGCAAVGYRSEEERFRRSASEFRRIGSGGLFSTVEDLARWDRCLRQSSLGTVTDLYLAGVSSPARVGRGRQRFAFGLVLSADEGLSTWGNGGAWDGYSAAFLHLPNGRVSAAILSNRGSLDAFRLAEQLIDIGLADTADAKPGALSWSRLKSGPNIEVASAGAMTDGRTRDGSDLGEALPALCHGAFYSEELDVFYEIDSDPRAAIVVHRGEDAVALLDRDRVRIHVNEARERGVTISAHNARHIQLWRVGPRS